MLNVEKIAGFLEQVAPRRLAEDWDNVGLLVGDPKARVRRVMTCLTLSSDTVQEAVAAKADLVVAHHPLPFRPLKRLTTESLAGRHLLQLSGARIAVYSPHTSWDSAAGGINDRLAGAIGLTEVRPLIEANNGEMSEGLGAGRCGCLKRPIALKTLAGRIKKFLNVGGLHRVGDPNTKVQSVAVACGSGGSFLAAARKARCDCLVTGETNFHTCLEAQDAGIALLLPGHYASERFSMEVMAELLAEEFPEAVVWASTAERDPLHWS